MARIHFVKNGKKLNGERLTRSSNISLSTAMEFLGRYESRHSKEPHTFNPNIHASDYAQYEFVVLEVSSEEICQKFPAEGYYYLVSLDPATCQNELGLSGSLI